MNNLTLRQALKRKRYVTPKGYYGWDDLIQFAKDEFTNKKSYLNKKINWMDATLSDIAPVCITAANHHDKIVREDLEIRFYLLSVFFEALPVFSIESDIFQSFQQSRVPSNFCIERFFSSNGIMFFPRENNSIAKFAIYHPMARFHRYDSLDTVKVIVFGLKNDVFNCSMYKKIEWSKDDFESSYSNVDWSEWKISSDMAELATSKMKEFASLFHQIFLYKSAYPSAELTYEQQARHGLIVPDKKRGVMGYNPKKLSPIIIGENYRIKRERVESTGTHASPQTHWRSGHWRQQPIGKRDNPEYKTIWIEPVLVNG